MAGMVIKMLIKFIDGRNLTSDTARVVINIFEDLDSQKVVKFCTGADFCAPFSLVDADGFRELQEFAMFELCKTESGRESITIDALQWLIIFADSENLGGLDCVADQYQMEARYTIRVYREMVSDSDINGIYFVLEEI